MANAAHVALLVLVGPGSQQGPAHVQVPPHRSKLQRRRSTLSAEERRSRVILGGPEGVEGSGRTIDRRCGGAGSTLLPSLIHQMMSSKLSRTIVSTPSRFPLAAKSRSFSAFSVGVVAILAALALGENSSGPASLMICTGRQHGRQL